MLCMVLLCNVVPYAYAEDNVESTDTDATDVDGGSDEDWDNWDEDDWEYDWEEVDGQFDDMDDYLAWAATETGDLVTGSEIDSGAITNLWDCYDALEANGEDHMAGYALCENTFDYDMDWLWESDGDDEWWNEMEEDDWWMEGDDEDWGDDDWDAMDDKFWEMIFFGEDEDWESGDWEDDGWHDMEEKAMYEAWGEFDSYWEEDASMYYLDEYFDSQNGMNGMAQDDWAMYFMGMDSSWLKDGEVGSGDVSDEHYFGLAYLAGTTNPHNFPNECGGEWDEDAIDHSGHDHGDDLNVDLDGELSEEDGEALVAVLTEGLSADVSTEVETDGTTSRRALQAGMDADMMEWREHHGAGMAAIDSAACQDAIAAAELDAFNFLGFKLDYTNDPILAASCAGETDTSEKCQLAERMARKAMLTEAWDKMFTEQNMQSRQGAFDTWVTELPEDQRAAAENEFDASSFSLSSLFAGQTSMLSMSLIAIFISLWN